MKIFSILFLSLFSGILKAQTPAGTLNLGTVKQVSGPSLPITILPGAGTVLKFTGNPANPITAVILGLGDVTNLNASLALLAPKSNPTFTGTLTASGTLIMTSGLDIASQLKAWTKGEAFEITSVSSLSANGVVLIGTVKWPDGTAGTYTAGTPLNTTWLVPDSYTITYSGSPSRTITQAAVSRDATTGTPITIPALTVAP